MLVIVGVAVATTRSVCAAEMLPNSLPSPLYTAVSERSPRRGPNSARPATPPFTGEVPSSVVPSKKRTESVGAP